MRAGRPAVERRQVVPQSNTRLPVHSGTKAPDSQDTHNSRAVLQSSSATLTVIEWPTAAPPPRALVSPTSRRRRLGVHHGDVVVIGGGYAGVRLARRLDGAARVTLVDRKE